MTLEDLVNDVKAALVDIARDIGLIPFLDRFCYKMTQQLRKGSGPR